MTKISDIENENLDLEISTIVGHRKPSFQPTGKSTIIFQENLE